MNELSYSPLLYTYRVVEFRTEELMKKAVEKVNKHMMNGRPLKVKEVSGASRKTHSSRCKLEMF